MGDKGEGESKPKEEQGHTERYTKRTDKLELAMRNAKDGPGWGDQAGTLAGESMHATAHIHLGKITRMHDLNAIPSNMWTEGPGARQG